MTDKDIEDIIKTIVRRIRTKVESNELTLVKQGLATLSEQAVYDAISELVDEGNIPPCKDIIYDKNGHQFPDIVIGFDSGYKDNVDKDRDYKDSGFKLGIEVKSSSSVNNSWSINGNSVLGTTSVDVDEVYIIFIKFNQTNGFDIKFARYQDSIADVVVTHSPRYKIDLNLDPSNSFFNRSNISYDDIKTSDNPIGLITDYFRSQGKTAWWLGDSGDEMSSSATIQSWNDSDVTLIEQIYGEAFVLFPEIINGSPRNKYSRLAKWLVAKYSIADSSLRDKFSAGGRVDLEFYIDGEQVIINNVAKVYAKLTDHNESINTAFQSLSSTELQEFWSGYRPIKDNVETRKRYWFTLYKANEAHQELITYIKNLFEINIP